MKIKRLHHTKNILKQSINYDIKLIYDERGIRRRSHTYCLSESKNFDLKKIKIAINGKL